MTLEEEIKQVKPFRSEFQKLLINIQFTSSWLNFLFSKRLKLYNITPQQYNVLRILKGKYPFGYHNQDVAERMIDKSSNCTRIVDKLLAKKLVTRKPGKKDRRAVVITITKNGLSLLEKIEHEMADVRIKESVFNEEKAKLINEWLEEVRMVFEQK